jgi:ubiquitin carboxyl-terminal hydrolase 47
MNSLLQNLYMTPEFRKAIYEWKYNERVDPKPEEDSIIYQLQGLFGKLDRKFPGKISTRDLVKIFQWHD